MTIGLRLCSSDGSPACLSLCFVLCALCSIAFPVVDLVEDPSQLGPLGEFYTAGSLPIQALNVRNWNSISFEDSAGLGAEFRLRNLRWGDQWRSAIHYYFLLLVFVVVM